METNYLDFELLIGHGKGREYPVSVIDSPAGEAQETMHFPFDELVLENRLKSLQIALLRSIGKSRRASLPEQKDVRDFGRDLFEALMCGEVRSRFAVSQERAAELGKGLRIKLRIKSPELAALPWEFFFDQSQGDYLCLSRNTPVVRYVELPQTIKPLKVKLPLRMLGMIANPSDLVNLDVEREKQRIEKAVSSLQEERKLELTWMQGQTWRDLHRVMRRGPWHIFHFIGHGGFDAEREEGLIYLSDENGEKQILSASQLGRLLADHGSLRFVLLNSCEGARGGKRDIFSSSASVLVQRGIPAVLAMQYEITDRAAVEFARTFYESLAEGLPIDTAAAEARKAVSLAVTNTLEWGTPVLYMRSPDGLLFSIKREPGVKKKSSEETVPFEPDTPPKEHPPQKPPPVKDVSDVITRRPVSKQNATFKRLSLIFIIGIVLSLIAYQVFKTVKEDNQYQGHMNSVKKYINDGDLKNARKFLAIAEKINNTDEVKGLRTEIEEKATEKMKVDFEKLKKSMKDRSKNKSNMQGWEKFLDKHKNAPENADTDMMKSEAKKFIPQLKRRIETKRRDRAYLGHIESAENHIFRGKYDMAIDSLSLAKDIKETDEVKELTKMIANFLGNKVRQKPKRMHKPSKDQWEAEFDYGIKMVYIPAGTFNMGSNEGRYYEKPEHKVYLDGYWIGKYEVTFEQYDRYCEEKGKEKPGDEGWGRELRPVINVFWHEAAAYCEWLKEKTGLNFKLPTEAQWEKAARGTKGLINPWGNSQTSGKNLNFADRQKWLTKKDNKDNKSDRNIDDGYAYTAPVDKYAEGASPYGTFNMAGNVSEWCSDWFDKNYYENSPAKNPQGGASGAIEARVLRGGSWCNELDNCRAYSRKYALPGSRFNSCGFRLVMNCPQRKAAD